MLIDAHAHLDLEDYAGDRAETIERARQVGVARILNVGVDPPRWNSSLELARRYPGFIYLALGLHPTDILRAGDPDAALDRLATIVNENPGLVVALGETGLDYYHEDVPPETQKIYFEKQIDLAEKLGLPLVIHCRDAMPDLLAILKRKALHRKIMLHCFSGTPAEAAECIALGPEVFISMAGPVTFTKAFERHEVARVVPLERMLVETDCPFLTPHPFRGKRNEPARVRLVAEKIAELKGISYEDVAEQTGANVRQLFGIV
jgi:TatD DNase family protein